MTDAFQKPYQQFIIDRIETAIRRLHKNPAYIKRCHQQDISGEVVEKLYHKLDDDERSTIRRHYEGEVVKQNFELDETYLQGMRDCIYILSCLDAFHREVQFDE